MPGKTVPPRKPFGASEKAVAKCELLPLELLLDMMWSFRDQAERLQAAGDLDDARLARHRAYCIAKLAAPYVHPRVVTGNRCR
jgi:hypothetical protein